MRKIKILQFPIANSFGGITHYAVNNWKWMDKNIFQCDFATMSRSLFFASDLEAMGSKIHYISCYAEQNKEQFIKEFDAILDNGYDVVHLHTKQWKSFLVEELCKSHGVKKVIVHSHSTRCDNNNEELRKKETEEHYRVRDLFNESLATDFWACSKLAADWLFGDRIESSRIKIMNNAIETDKFLYDSNIRNNLRARYNLENRFVIGNVGRLVYQKNQSFLIDVFAEVSKSCKDAVLVLIGDGELELALKQQCKKLGIEDRVLFMGKQTNVNELYSMMDLFVLPSNFEGFPITLVEAQASGIKCLASDVITKEVALCDNIQFLPLVKNVWKENMITRINDPFYDRTDMKNVIVENGYDSMEQIMLIQNEYAKNISGGGGTKV